MALKIMDNISTKNVLIIGCGVSGLLVGQRLLMEGTYRALPASRMVTTNSRGKRVVVVECPPGAQSTNVGVGLVSVTLRQKASPAVLETIGTLSHSESLALAKLDLGRWITLKATLARIEERIHGGSHFSCNTVRGVQLCWLDSLRDWGAITYIPSSGWIWRTGDRDTYVAVGRSLLNRFCLLQNYPNSFNPKTRITHNTVIYTTGSRAIVSCRAAEQSITDRKDLGAYGFTTLAAARLMLPPWIGFKPVEFSGSRSDRFRGIQPLKPQKDESRLCLIGNNWQSKVRTQTQTEDSSCETLDLLEEPKAGSKGKWERLIVLGKRKTRLVVDASIKSVISSGGILPRTLQLEKEPWDLFSPTESRPFYEAHVARACMNVSLSHGDFDRNDDSSLLAFTLHISQLSTVSKKVPSGIDRQALYPIVWHNTPAGTVRLDNDSGFLDGNGISQQKSKCTGCSPPFPNPDRVFELPFNSWLTATAKARTTTATLRHPYGTMLGFSLSPTEAT